MRPGIFERFHTKGACTIRSERALLIRACASAHGRAQLRAAEFDVCFEPAQALLAYAMRLNAQLMLSLHSAQDDAEEDQLASLCCNAACMLCMFLTIGLRKRGARSAAHCRLALAHSIVLRVDAKCFRAHRGRAASIVDSTAVSKVARPPPSTGRLAHLTCADCVYISKL